MPDTAARAPLSLRRLVDLTPASRDRTVDGLRAAAIVVVVLWHWALSVTHRSAGGSFTMPNPIGEVRGLWLATWILQVMPLFFVLGGYANHAAMRPGFLRSRMRRLLVPAAAFLGAWAGLELVLFSIVPDHRSVVTWGLVTFVPLWFVGAYAAVTALAPWTVRLHQRFGARAALALGLTTFAADRLAPSGLAWDVARSLLVFTACHQLGYLWRDGTLLRSVRRPALLAAGGALLLVVLTQLVGYRRSMVAEAGQPSNMFPASACIVALACLQTGLALLARPALGRLFARRGPWTVAAAVNGVAMTVLCWHMTAWLAVALIWERMVGPLGSTPTAHWWANRPVWVALPLVVLVPTVALWSKIERAAR